MKKIAFLLLVLSMTRVAVAYAETNTASNSSTANQQSYFFGNSAQSAANLNQVLALLVGPRGVPGPAGVAGKDGFVGLNGQDGKDGLPGAPGAVGPQGPAGLNGKDGVNGATGATGGTGPAGPAGNAAYAVIPIDSANTTDCPSGLGGLKYHPGTGSDTIVCNGGSGSGTGNLLNIVNGYASGAINSTSCQGTTPIGISLARHFTGTDFVFGDIAVTGIESACSGKTMNFYFKINGSGSLVNSSNYSNGRFVRCAFTISGATLTASSSLTTACSTSTDSTGSVYGISTFAMSEISTADYINKIGFEIV